MKVYQITREAAPAPVKVPPVPKLPDISALTPGEPIEPSPGERIEMNKDGTISYGGAFGTFIYDKTGKALKYSTPNFNGLGQTVDLTTQSTTQSYNQGPMSMSNTKDKKGNVIKTKASYDIGLGVLGHEKENGITTKSWTPRSSQEDPITQKDMYSMGNKDKEATYDQAMKQVQQPATESAELEAMLRIAGLK